jgi:outer membrane protein assembly factor BamB
MKWNHQNIVNSSMVMRSKLVVCGFVCAFVALSAELVDDKWPQFRGPGGLGLGNDKVTLPSEFGPGKAMLWKTALTLGHGSPCVWGDRIFVTGFDPGSRRIEVISVNRKDGKIVWRQTAPAGEIEKVHDVSSPATSTPVTDGEKVYVYIGSYGILAYDWNGKLAWEYPMGVSKSPYGSGTSPVLAGDLVLITRDYPPDPFMVAVQKKDGKLAWKADLVKSSQPGPRTSHATPVIWRDQIILNRPGEVSAYAPRDGKRLWWFPTSSSGTSTPSAGDGVLYVNAFSMVGDPEGAVELKPFSYALEKYDTNKDGKLSESEAPANDLYFLRRAGMPDNITGAHFTIKQFFRMIDANQDGLIDEAEYNRVREFRKFLSSTVPAGLLSIRPAGEGDLSATALQWSEKRNVPEVTTPLEYRGRVYMVTAGGIVSCVDAKTGKVIYRGRVNAPGAYFASPVAAGGKVFVASAEGVVTVLGGGETLEVLANNDLGEPVYGTPALAGPAIYVRSSQHLWAFGAER